MSGYTDEAIVNHGVLQAGVAFIQKPFSLQYVSEQGTRATGRKQQVQTY